MYGVRLQIKTNTAQNMANNLCEQLALSVHQLQEEAAGLNAELAGFSERMHGYVESSRRQGLPAGVILTALRKAWHMINLADADAAACQSVVDGRPRMPREIAGALSGVERRSAELLQKLLTSGKEMYDAAQTLYGRCQQTGHVWRDQDANLDAAVQRWRHCVQLVRMRTQGVLRVILNLDTEDEVMWEEADEPEDEMDPHTAKTGEGLSLDWVTNITMSHRSPLHLGPNGPDVYTIPIHTRVFHGTSAEVQQHMICERPNWFGAPEIATGYCKERLQIDGNVPHLYEYEFTANAILLAMDSCRTIRFLWQRGDAAHRKMLNEAFRCVHRADSEMPLRNSRRRWDLPLVKAICAMAGIDGYAAKRLPNRYKTRYGAMHAELFLCDPSKWLRPFTEWRLPDDAQPKR